MNQIETPDQTDDRQAEKAGQTRQNQHLTARNRLKSLLRLLAIAAAIIGVFVGLIWLGEKQDGSVHQPSPLDSQVSEIDHVVGPDTAVLTLIEYADFQCPTCAVYAPLMEELSAAYPDKLRFVYRYFPLQTIHPNANLSAQAAEAAGKQGKFFEMHDLLFAQQKVWSSLKDPHEQFAAYAQTLGLNVDQFKTDLDSQEIEDRVSADYRSGLAVGIGGTPTFYLNGNPIENPRGSEAFKALLDTELSSLQTTK